MLCAPYLNCWKRNAYYYNEFIYRQTIKVSKVSKREPVATSEQSLEPW